MPVRPEMLLNDDYFCKSISIIALMLVMVTVVALCSTQLGIPQKTATEQAGSLPIRLILRTEKQSYFVGEPIKVTAFLENVSQDKFFYVGRDLGSLLSEMPYHFIYLSVKDSDGKFVAVGRSAASALNTKETVAERLIRSYVQLSPGTIYGLRDNYELPLSPGTYSLKAVYQELEALSWRTEDFSGLKIPVWIKPLESNVVRIKIIPVSAKRKQMYRPTNSRHSR